MVLQRAALRNSYCDAENLPPGPLHASDTRHEASSTSIQTELLFCVLVCVYVTSLRDIGHFE